MTGRGSSYDRVGVIQIGGLSFGVPLSDVERFLSSTQLRTVEDHVPWIKGGVQELGSADLMPVVDLAVLWQERRLEGRWTHLVCTRAGFAFGATSYTTTSMHEIHTLRPGPWNPALGRAVVIDDRPLPVLDVYRLVQVDQWQALAVPA